MAQMQYGSSISTDIDDKTWIFEMSQSNGNFAIIKCDNLDFQNKLEHLMSVIDKYTLEEIESKLP